MASLYAQMQLSRFLLQCQSTVNSNFNQKFNFITVKKLGYSVPFSRFKLTHLFSFNGELHETISFQKGFIAHLNAFTLNATRKGDSSSTVESEMETDALLTCAWEILDEFNVNDIRGESQTSLSSEEGLLALKTSVIVASKGALALDGSQPLLGVCAGNVDTAILALKQWTKALNCEMILPKSENGATPNNPTAIGPVYIKYNAKSKSCVMVPYFGKFRGVIVQMGQKQVGHLPLNLYDE